MRQNVPIDESAMLKVVAAAAANGGGNADRSSKCEMEFQNFLPGSVVAVRVNLHPVSQNAVVRLRLLITGLSFPAATAAAHSKSQNAFDLVAEPVASATWEDLQESLTSMTLADMNVALYRCEKEEVEDGRPGSYTIPNYGAMQYCGFQVSH